MLDVKALCTISVKALNTRFWGLCSRFESLCLILVKATLPKYVVVLYADCSSVSIINQHPMPQGSRGFIPLVCHFY